MFCHTLATMEPTSKTTALPVVPKQYIVPFLLLSSCFALWGLLNNMSDLLVPAFEKIFLMNPKESVASQIAFYFAYGCLAIPAALLIKKYSYKIGVLAGLGLFSLGVLGYIPGGIFRNYDVFVFSIFIFSCGLSILETSCNPYVLAMGPEETSVRRLNFAQAFNPIGSLAGALIGKFLILGNLDAATKADRLDMAEAAPQQLSEIQSTELFWLCLPYFILAVISLIIWVTILKSKMPEGQDTEHAPHFVHSIQRLCSIPRYWTGVIAQFFYVGLQIGVWTYIVKYCKLVINVTESEAGWIYTASIALFILCRIGCTAMMKYINPANMMSCFAIMGILFTLGTIYLPPIAAVCCLIGISGAMSLMFPTIYGIALRGLGHEVKLGAAGLIMAILGAVILTPLMGYTIQDLTIKGLDAKPAMIQQVVTSEIAKDPEFMSPEVHNALKDANYTFLPLTDEIQSDALARMEATPVYQEVASHAVRFSYWWAILCFFIVLLYSFVFRNAHLSVKEDSTTNNI